MVTVFNPQALSDPGPTAASGLIGSGMGAVSNLMANRATNRINLVNQLLQSGGLGIREYLTRKNEQEQGKDTLQALIDTGMIPAGKDFKIPEDANIDPKAIASMASQYGPLAQLKIANMLTGIGEKGSKGGVLGAGPVLQEGVNRAGNLAGISPTAPQEDFTPTYDPITKTYKAGASVPTPAQNLYEQGARTANEMAQANLDKLNREQIQSKKNTTQLTINQQNKLTQGQGAMRTYDESQAPFVIGGKPVKYNEMAQGDIDAYLDAKQYDPKLEATANTAYQGKRRAVSDLIAMYNDIRPLVADNALKAIVNRVGTDPNALLLTNDPRAAKLAAFINQLRGSEALKIAVQTQGSKPTDRDVEMIVVSMPDLLGNKVKFDAQMKTFLGKTLKAAIDEGIVLNRVADVAELGRELNTTFGKEYDYGTPFDALPNTALSQAVLPSARPAAKPAVKPSAQTMNRVNQAKGQPAPTAAPMNEYDKELARRGFYKDANGQWVKGK